MCFHCGLTCDVVYVVLVCAFVCMGCFGLIRLCALFVIYCVVLYGVLFCVSVCDVCVCVCVFV